MPSVPPSDLTEFEERVRHLNRLASIGTLSASMAHEIKNALVPIRTYFELQKSSPDELAEVARRELRRIESLVNQMLKYGGPAKPQPTVIHLHEVLENALRLIQFQLAGKMIALELSFAASPDCVWGDAYQLEQAFGNVLINALEAMSAGGRLSISTEVTPAAESDVSRPQLAVRPVLRVRIRDTGSGISPENLARLFDTFFTTKPNGTGLGLTITRRIIQEHGGAITVESEPNKGTTFTISLPAAN